MTATQVPPAKHNSAAAVNNNISPDNGSGITSKLFGDFAFRHTFRKHQLLMLEKFEQAVPSAAVAGTAAATGKHFRFLGSYAVPARD